MTPSHPPPPRPPARTLLGRADLLHAILAGETELANRLADRLGLRPLPDAPLVTDPLPLLADEALADPAPRSAESAPADPRATPPPDAFAPMRFLRVRSYRLVQPETDVTEPARDAPPLPPDDPAYYIPIPWTPIAAWRDLAPRLRASAALGQDLWWDVPRFIDRFARGDILHDMPRREGPRWGERVLVLLDTAERLIPLHRDQNHVLTRLQSLLGPGRCQGVVVERPDSFFLGDHFLRPDDLPVPSLLVALGDLGSLAGSHRLVADWQRLGERHRLRGGRTLALVPCVASARAAGLDAAWDLVPWDRPGLGPPAAADIDRLLVAAGHCAFVEPILLRYLARGMLGLGIAAELAVWNHPDVATRHASGMAFDFEAHKVLRDRFSDPAETDDEPRARVVRAVRSWREIQGALHHHVDYVRNMTLDEAASLPDADQHLLPSSDQERLGDLEAAGATALAGESFGWRTRLLHRLPNHRAERPFWKKQFSALQLDAPAPMPGYRPIDGLAGDEERRFQLVQRGGSLVWTPFGSAVEGSPLGILRSTNLEILHAEIDVEAEEEPPPPPLPPLPEWASAAGADEVGRWIEFALEGVTQRMRWIEPGTFMMGSPPDEHMRREDEVQHEVTLTQGFWMFDTAVTQALYEAVMGQNPSRFRGADRPVEQVSWDDAVRFCQTLNERLPGLEVGLPTEAQWEYACRAGTITPFSFGEDVSTDEVNHDGNYPYRDRNGEFRKKTVPVASLPANPWGLYEMHGSVFEWCADWFGDYPKGAVTDPTGPRKGSTRVVRGGAWLYDDRGVRSAYRDGDGPDWRFNGLGFRCLLVPPASEASESRGPEAPSSQPAGPEAGSSKSNPPPRMRRSGKAVLLRLAAGDANTTGDLPKTNVELESDRGVMGIEWMEPPGWASAMGRDRYGLWADIDIHGVRQRTRWIPPGHFWMGSPDNEEGRDGDEGPRHEVVLTEGYWLFDTPVTQGLYEAVTGANPSEFKRGDNYPVENVSWYDARSFIQRLNQKELGLGLALPTEAQWERACRAGTDTRYAFGDAFDPKRIWCGDHAEYEQRTRTVGSLPANGFGLYDMHGNVWEWCMDYWHEEYEGSLAIDPTGPGEGWPRVVRGGAWNFSARYVRSADRNGHGPVGRVNCLGFRCLLVPQGNASGPVGPNKPAARRSERRSHGQ